MNDLILRKTHAQTKAAYWQKMGREDRVAEYLKELAAIEEEIQNFPLQLG